MKKLLIIGLGILLSLIFFACLCKHPHATITSFSATPTNITCGSSTTLSGTFFGGPRLKYRITPGNYQGFTDNNSGNFTVVVSPKESTNYTLYVSNDCGTDSLKTTVNVYNNENPTIYKGSINPNPISGHQGETISVTLKLFEQNDCPILTNNFIGNIRWKLVSCNDMGNVASLYIPNSNCSASTAIGYEYFGKCTKIDIKMGSATDYSCALQVFYADGTHDEKLLCSASVYVRR